MVNEQTSLLLKQAEELKRQAAILLEMAAQALSLADHAKDENKLKHNNSVLRESPITPYQNTFRAKIRQKGQVTIPAKVRKELDLDEGDSLLGIYDSRSGELRLIEDVSVDPKTAWLWRERWQEMLFNSMSDFMEGRTTKVESLNEVAEK
jgi:AbrB family looped-hinge helix DNA binding protein